MSEALELGPKSIDYTGLIAWLAEQIGTFIKIDETINPTHTPDDASSFLLELSCFLKEIGCVNQNLTTGNVNQRLADKGNRTLLIEILVSELMACKLLQAKEKETNTTLEVIIVSILKFLMCFFYLYILLCIICLLLYKSIYNTTYKI